jgi:CubicO group peptidase (beta-lactamase class C family)
MAGAAVSPAAASMVPGATVSVRFDGARILSASASGMADPAANRAVAANDPVRIASVSKLVVALGVLRLVDQGTLDLDEDVSRYLGWTFRHPRYPASRITLRLLLGHRSGLTDGEDRYIIPLGETLRDRVSEPGVWDAGHPPGTYFRYANINFPVIASVMEAATGERFDRLMDRLVMKPLSIDACFNWTSCSDAAVARAVVLTAADGTVLRDDLKGRRPECPVVPARDGSCALSAYRPGDNGALFSPQGGLRISMLDLARIGQVFLVGGRGFLSPASFRELTRPGRLIDEGTGARDAGFHCRFGLSLHWLANRAKGCADDPFGDGKRRYGHSGEAYGLRSGLWIDGRKGIAFFVTAVPPDAPAGRSAFKAVEEAVLRP